MRPLKPALTLLFLADLLLSLILLFLSFGTLPFFSHLVISSVTGSLLLVAFLGRVHSRSFIKDPFWPGYLAFLAWLLVQALAQWLNFPGMGSLGPWAPRINLFLMFWTGLGFYVIAREILSDRRWLSGFISFWAFMGAAFGSYFMIRLFAEGIRAEMFRPQWLNLRFPGLMAGTVQPNDLADLFIPGAFYALSLALYHWIRRPSDPLAGKGKIFSAILLYLCLAGLSTGAILFTQSRAGILSFFAALIFFMLGFILIHRRQKAAMQAGLFVFLILTVFLISLGLKDILHEMGTLLQTVEEESEGGTRSWTIAASLELAKRHPVLGVGLGNFQTGWLQAGLAGSFFPERSYCDPLWIWAETGMIGVFFLLGSLLLSMLKNIATAVKTKSYLVAYILLSSVSTLLALFLHSLVDPTFYVPALFWMLMMIAGLSSAARNLESLERSEANTLALSRRSPLASALGLALFSALILGLLYFRAAAYQVSRRTGDKEALIRATQWDPFQAGYLLQLARLYEQEYRSEPTDEKKQQVLAAYDEAIERNILEVPSYLARARFLWDAGDREGVEETFQMLQDRLPDFYLGELAISAFYLSLASEVVDLEEVRKFETMGLRHYVKAKKGAPQISLEDFGRFASFDARQRFRQLLAEGRV